MSDLRKGLEPNQLVTALLVTITILLIGAYFGRMYERGVVADECRDKAAFYNNGKRFECLEREKR